VNDESVEVAVQDGQDTGDDRDVAPLVNITPLLFNVRQLGAMLGGVSERKIRAMVSAGQLPRPIQLGRLVRWRRSDVEQWIVSLS
jgi:excisionase family DNA binding protein